MIIRDGTDTLSLAADSPINNTLIEGGAGDDAISGRDQVDLLSGGDDADTSIGATDGEGIDGGIGATAVDDANDFDPNPTSGTITLAPL